MSHRPSTMALSATLMLIAIGPGLAQPGPLGSVGEILALPDSAIETHPPVHLEGTITCLDPEWELFFLTDDRSDTIFIDMDNLPDDLRMGMRLAVEGTVSVGSIRPFVKTSRIEILKTVVPIPRSREVRAADLDGIELDSQWVRVTGTVVSTWSYEGRGQLLVLDGEDWFETWVPDLAKPARLIGAKVTFEGIAIAPKPPKHNRKRETVFSPGIRHLTILAPPQRGGTRHVNCWNFVDEVQKSRNKPATRGQTVMISDNHVCLRDTTGGVWVRLDREHLPKIGEWIEITPAESETPPEQHPLCRWKSLGKSSMMPPRFIADPMNILDVRDGDFVEFDGTVHELQQHGGNLNMEFLAGDRIVDILLTGPSSPSVREGARLRIRCIAQAGSAPVQGPRFIALPSGWYEVIRPASPWTKEVVTYTAAGCGVVIVILLNWSLLLRRRVGLERERAGFQETLRLRERALERRYTELFEKASDLVLQVDRTGRILSANESAARVLRQSGLRTGNGHSLPTAEIDRFFTEDLANGERSVDLNLPTRDGGRLVLDARCSPSGGDDAKSVQIIARDITETRELEKRLRELAYHAAVTEERQRREIASQLHDLVGQDLTACGFKIESLISKSDGGDAAELGRIHALLKRTISKTRSLVVELSPPVLHELGIVEALKWLGERTAKEFELPVSVVEYGRTVEIPGELQILLFRTARELLFNCVKHAQATSVQIRLEASADSVVLEVTDDGCGFPEGFALGPRHTSGYGLISIRQTLDHFGGTITVGNDSPHGAMVRIQIPLPDEH